MSVLLDACAVLALASGDLPAGAATALKTAPDAFVSVVSVWEIAIKAAAGKLQLQESPLAWSEDVMNRYELRQLPLDSQTACAAAALPRMHRDPFDRVLVALAQSRMLTLLTSDQNIARYPNVVTAW